mgnify:FL=1
MSNQDNLAPSLFNVNENQNPVPLCLQDVLVWISNMVDRGIYPEITARLYTTALNKIASILVTEPTPVGVQAVLESIEDLGNRYAIKTNSNPNTVRSYVSRARNALQDYLEYQAAPTKFKGRTLRLASKEKASPARKQLSAPQETASCSEQEQDLMRVDQSSPVSSISTEVNKKRFTFQELTTNFLQLFPLCQEPISVDELTTFLLQLLPKCNKGLSAEQLKKLFIH